MTASSLSNNAPANPHSNVPLSCRLYALLQVRDLLAGGMAHLQEDMDHLLVDMDHLQDTGHLQEEEDMVGDGRGKYQK